MSPSPTSRHQQIVGELHRQMANYFKGKPCRLFVSPMDVLLSEDDVVQPELRVLLKDVFDFPKVSLRIIRARSALPLT